MEYDVPTIPAATVQITIGSNLRPYIKDQACCPHIFFHRFHTFRFIPNIL